MSYPMTMRTADYQRKGALSVYIPFQKKRSIHAPVSSRKKNSITIEKVSDKLRFKYPRTFEWNKVDDYYDVHIFYPDIEIMEDKREKLLDALKEEFQYLWDTFAEEEDENLSNNAQKLKKWLHTNLEMR